MCSEVLKVVVFPVKVQWNLEVRKMLLSHLLILFLLLICSGYDFGYLIKILTNSNLPEEELDFFEILRLFFPVIYDVKYLMKSCKNLKVSNLLMVWNKFCIWRQSMSCLKYFLYFYSLLLLLWCILSIVLSSFIYLILKVLWEASKSTNQFL